MKNKLTAFRNFVIISAFILSSFTAISQTDLGLGVTDKNSAKSQSLPVINFLTSAQATNTLYNMVNNFNDNFSQYYGFKVQFGPHIGISSIYDGIVADFQSQSSAIDVLAMDVTWPADFAQAGYILPLNGIFNSSYQSQFFQSDIATGTYNGKIYSVPWFHDSALLYYRSDVLQYAFNNGIIPADRPPQTWSELSNWTIAMMKDQTLVTKFNLTSGFVWQGKSYEGLMCDLMEYLGATGTYTFLSSNQFKNSSGLRDALTYMKSLIDTSVSPKSVLTYDEEGSRAVWNAGNSIFMRNWPYAYPLSLQSAQLNGSLVSGADHNVQQFNITAMPAQNETILLNGLARTSCLGGYQLGIGAYSKYPNQAEKFIMWLTAAQQQLTFFLGEGTTPTLKALYNSPAVIHSKQSYVHNFLPIFESSIPRPITPDYQQISSALQPVINEYLAGGITLDAAINNITTSVNSISNQNQFTLSDSIFTFMVGAVVIGLIVCIAVIIYYPEYKKRGLNMQGKKLTEKDSGTYTSISKSICPVCGSKIDPGGSFCQNCGSKIR